MIHIDLMYISMISILAPAFLGVAVFNRLSSELKVLSVFVLITLVLEAVVFVAFNLGANNMAVFHTFTYVEFSCISLIYYGIFKSKKYIRLMPLVLYLLFLAFSIHSLVNWEFLDRYNSIQRAGEHILVLTYVIVFIASFSRSSNMGRLKLRPMYILSIGFLLYFSGTFLTFLNANNYIEFDDLFNWSIHSILNIFLNTIYFIVLWTASKGVKRS